MLRLIGTGRLVADPELRDLPDGSHACEIRIAVDRMHRGGDTGYLDFCQYGPAGEAAARTLTKGWLVLVDGRLETSNYASADGNRSTRHRGIGQITFLAAPRGVGDEPPADEVPF